MAKDWIHRRNEDFLAQAKVFSQSIAADPGSWGIDPLDADALLAAYLDFAEKFRTADQPSTRTTSAIIARDGARKILAQRMRIIAARIRGNPAVTDAMRIAIQMTVPGHAAPAPQHPPTTKPRVQVLSLKSNWLTLRITDFDNFHRGKPPHYLGAQIYLFASRDQKPPADLGRWQSLAITTKSRTIVKLPFIDPGTCLFLCARWLNTHGYGPASDITREWTGEMVITGSLRAA